MLLPAKLESEYIRGIDIPGLYRAYGKEELLDERLFKYLCQDILVSVGCGNSLASVQRSDVSRVMYEKPLDEMPLLINEPILGVFASWRLEISQ